MEFLNKSCCIIHIIHIESDTLKNKHFVRKCVIFDELLNMKTWKTGTTHYKKWFYLKRRNLNPINVK